MNRPAVLRHIESQARLGRLVFRLRLNDAKALRDYVRHLESKPAGAIDPVKEQTVDYVCTRPGCGRTAQDCRENGCVKGPCPMAPFEYCPKGPCALPAGHPGDCDDLAGA